MPNTIQELLAEIERSIHETNNLIHQTQEEIHTALLEMKEEDKK